MRNPVSRRRTLVVYGMILVVLPVLVLLILEVVMRLFVPHGTVMEMVRGESLAVPDPIRGYRLRPGAIAVEHAPEFHARYEVNEQGRRDAAVYPSAKSRGTRLLLVGDSFAFGVGNDYDDIWPVLLEKRLAANGPLEIVKAGVPGYDTRLELLHLQEIFAETAPDAVIFGFMLNDLFTNEPLKAREATDVQAEGGVVAATEKFSTLHLLSLSQRLMMNNDRLYSLLYWLTPRREYFQAPPTPAIQSRLAITADLFREAAKFCQEHGVRLLVLSIPQLFEVLVAGRGYEYDAMDVHLADREMERLATQEGYDWIASLDTLASVYKEEGENLYYRWDGHLNRRGNQVVADYFAGQLTARLAHSARR